MKHWIRFCVIMVLAIPARGLAWNATGHMTVAMVAWKDLSPEVQRKVGEILKTHPHYSQLLLERRPADVSEAEWAFLRASVWPDMVRPARPGIDRYRSPAVTHYHKGSWHYVDIPFRVASSQPATRRASTRPAAAEESILTALPANMKTLSDANAKMEDRAVALAWVEHLVGDLHQPLHAATMYSERFPGGDKGGNDQMVRGNSGVTRLHAYWDDLMGTSEAYGAIAFLADEVSTGANEQTKARQKEKSKWDVWAKESHDHAVALVYLDGELKTALSRDWEDKKIKADDVPLLPPSYDQNARALARQRILLAGKRLAEQVKEAIGE